MKSCSYSFSKRTAGLVSMKFKSTLWPRSSRMLLTPYLQATLVIRQQPIECVGTHLIIVGLSKLNPQP